MGHLVFKYKFWALVLDWSKCIQLKNVGASGIKSYPHAKNMNYI